MSIFYSPIFPIFLEVEDLPHKSLCPNQLTALTEDHSHLSKTVDTQKAPPPPPCGIQSPHSMGSPPLSLCKVARPRPLQPRVGTDLGLAVGRTSTGHAPPFSRASGGTQPTSRMLLACYSPPPPLVVVSTSQPGVFVMTAYQALIRPSGEDAMGRSCILDSPPQGQGDACGSADARGSADACLS